MELRQPNRREELESDRECLAKEDLLWSKPTYIQVSQRKWFRYLTKHRDDGKQAQALLTYFDAEELAGKLLVCYQNSQWGRVFSLFPNYRELLQYQNQLQPAERNLYEVFLGTQSQKPHFDLDIRTDDPGLHQRILDELVRSLESVLDQHHLDYSLQRNILVLSSHDPDCPRTSTIQKRTWKWSYHLVVDGYYHANNLEAKAFARQVINRMEGRDERTGRDYSSWVDPKVYSSAQQFRIVGNCKEGTNRVFRFLKKWVYQDQVIHHLFRSQQSLEEQVFLATLVSAVTGCKPLPSFIDFDQEPLGLPFRGGLKGSDILSQEQIDRALELVEHYTVREEGSTRTYEFRDVLWTKYEDRQLILLNRRKPSRCAICSTDEDHYHDRDNPYLVISKGKVYFDCRGCTSEDRSYLGTVTTESPEPSAESADVEESSSEEVNRGILYDLRNMSYPSDDERD